MIRLEMKNYNIISRERSSKNINVIINMKYEFPAGEEILSSDQSRIIEQTRFTYSSLGKTFEKQIKTFEDQGI